MINSKTLGLLGLVILGNLGNLLGRWTLGGNKKSQMIRLLCTLSLQKRELLPMLVYLFLTLVCWRFLIKVLCKRWPPHHTVRIKGVDICKARRTVPDTQQHSNSTIILVTLLKYCQGIRKSFWKEIRTFIALFVFILHRGVESGIRRALFTK